MKITLKNEKEIELTAREAEIYLEAYKEGSDFTFKSLMVILIIMGFIIIGIVKCAAQPIRTIYRQTLIIKSGKPTEIITWQKVTVNYLDKLYEYDRKFKKRISVLIVFGKEGTSPLSDWIKFEIKEGDTLYNYKRNL